MHSQAGATPAAAVERAGAELAELDERLWAAVTDEALLETVASLEAHQAHLAAVRAQALAEIAARDLPRKQLAWASTGEWYAHLAGLPLRDARRAVTQAPLLVGEREGILEALRAGLVSPDQASIICRAVDQLPLDPTLRCDAERALVRNAGTLNATDLRRAADYLVEQVDPDRSQRRAEAELDREERAAHLGRFFAITDDGAGGARIKGRGSAEDAATLRAALLPLTKPAPALDADDPAAPVQDPRGHSVRTWDALVEIAQHSLDTGRQPESHGARPCVGVLIDYASLTEGLATSGEPALTHDGLRLSHAAVRRLSCDADIIPVCLGTRGQVLDVGRTHRLVTPSLWQALIARDRHCSFPGCTRPPLMSHGHHITHWADGGPTALHNLVMLCGHHHRVIHDTPWEVRLNPTDGRPEFRPPPRRRGDPPPVEWIRHRPRRE